MSADAVDILGNGWKSQIAEGHRLQVFTEWNDSIHDKRPFELVYAFRANPERQFIGKTRVLRNRAGLIHGYVGTLTPLE